MNWSLSERVDLRNKRIPSADGARQMATAAEILRRLNDQPGVVLADEVGMGKTFVALAVAVSVVEATNFRKPVVVMVPAAVADKWPREWDVFESMCLTDHSLKIRATHNSIKQPSEFLKLLDDPASRRNHIIFLTHGALTNPMNDSLVQLALVRQAMRGRPSLSRQRRAFPYWAHDLLGNRSFRVLRDADVVESLMGSDPSEWREILDEHHPDAFSDDPVPFILLSALGKVDLSALIENLRAIPLRESANVQKRLSETRSAIRAAMRDVWSECLRALRMRLPLLILDEAHHAKNPWTRFAGLFSTPEAQSDAEALQRKGPLGNVFDRMLFMTATPFQLGHRELLQVMRHFDAIRWSDKDKQTAFDQAMKDLGRNLDEAQGAALRLEHAWGRLSSSDFAGIDPTAWSARPNDSNGERLSGVCRLIDETDLKLRAAESRLRPWVIRHARADKETRRNILEGAAINDPAHGGGLQIAGRSVLPFLLAARAQAVVSMEGLYGDQSVRAYFAEGLASSFEAYRETRNRAPSESPIDEDGATANTLDLSEEVQWYLNSVDKALPTGDTAIFGEHPKIRATVDRVLSLWQSGEKVVAFCFYRATGRALRSHISRAMRDVLVQQGAASLGLPTDDHEAVMSELDRFGERFFDPNAPVTKSARESLEALTSECSLGEADRNATIDVMLRFLRTPSFLVRHVDLASIDQVAALQNAFESSDASGISLREKLSRLARFIGDRVPNERAELLDALGNIQTGEIFAVGASFFHDKERTNRKEALLPNVRLANGGVDAQTRRRLMLAFNTPLFPEVLVASSVMAEGVDLHLNCRHVIHHDLDWNPSVLEQRTGRVDRLGSKAEIARLPIVVYQPYIESTQDEKQFRVVKDRERWFNVVMGERMTLDEHATDRAMERIPLPDAICQRLMLKLSL